MNYHIPSLSDRCNASTEPFVPGEAYWSALVERDGELTRTDFRAESWTGPPENSIGHWRGTVPTPPTQPRPLDADALMQYFEQLADELNPHQEKLRYILALLLLQKRRLSVSGRRDDGEFEFLELLGSQGEGPFLVRDPKLTPEESEQLGTQLSGHLAAM